jgi:hypothetical protein
MGHKCVRGEMWFEGASVGPGFGRGATRDQEGGEKRENRETPVKGHRSSTNHGPRPAAFLIRATSAGLL